MFTLSLFGLASTCLECCCATLFLDLPLLDLALD